MVLSHPGFHTHGQAMGQRMVVMKAVAGTGISVGAPSNASVMPMGVYLMFVVQGGVPSEGVWIELGE